MMRIRLFTSAYPERHERRRAEYAEALLRNLANSEIDEVTVLAEDGAELPDHSGLRRVTVSVRPTYTDFLSHIRNIADKGDISIIANSDIWFDDGLAVLRCWELPQNTVFALSRWDTREDGGAGLNERNDSQDAWLFSGRPNDVDASFPVGVPRCDNRFVKELEQAGYAVRNPSFSIRAHHLHAGLRNEYPANPEQGFVEGPYGYVWPHNLMSLPRTLLFNARNPSRRAGWRFDRRYWHRALRLHWIENGLRALLPHR